jgi:phosphoribosylamine--glycine ligase
MNILFVSGELIAGDLALQLQREGNALRLFIDCPTQRDCLNGFVPKTTSWEAELDWVGKAGLIVFDDVGYGDTQDRLRREGYRVVGGSAGGDRLELDRSFAQQVFAECGMRVEPTYTFADAGDALAFVSAQGGAWVVKQNDHQSHLNYVGVMEDGSDVRGVLASYQCLGICNLSVQRHLRGVEVAVGRFFNGHDWVGPIEVNQEHKGLLNGELGPKTGEMGTLMWYSQNSRLFDATLGRLHDHLREVDFRGDIAINCFVDGETVYPIEATARFGCPATYLQSALHRTPWTELLNAIADGRPCDLAVRDGYAVGLTLAVPPFPYGARDIPDVSSAGLPMQLRCPLTADEANHLHLEGVALVQGNDVDEGQRTVLTSSLGYAVFVTGAGTTVEAAQHAAYSLAEKIVIPKVMYRTDIGDHFLAGDRERLQAFGWI